MNQELADIWEQALAVMEGELTQSELAKPSFVTWLKGTRPLAYHDDTLVLGVPNDFAREWLETKYAPLIKRTLQSIVRRSMTLKFVIPHVEDDPAEVEVAAAEAPQKNGEVVPAPFLNPRYTFETFVIGNSNRFAHAASQAVAESPAKAYNPLFLYGGVGLGKTHLMQAIGHAVCRKLHALRVVYVNCEAFVNEFINSIRDDKSVEFQAKYRNVDLLLIDDIQFLAGKERTQEEFFHTFNALYEARRQIVVSSDRPPKEIPTLEDRLRSRFEWGLITDIQAPDLETREAILRKKAQLEGVEVPVEVLQYIATKIDSNIRELEGALNRLLAYSSMTRSSITIALGEEVLKDLLPATRARPITIDSIQEAVARYYNLRVEDLKAKKRSRAVAYPRQVAMYLSRELTDASLPRIGEEFGGRDHTTVIHAHDKITRDIATGALGPSIEELMERLRRA